MGSEPKKRLELIQSLEPNLQKLWIRNIPAEFLQNMLGSQQQLTECHKAIKMLRNGKSLRRVVNRDFLNRIQRDDLPFERYWHLRGFNHRGLARVKPCPENALNLLTGLPQDEKFLKKMFSWVCWRFGSESWVYWWENEEVAFAISKVGPKIVTGGRIESSPLAYPAWGPVRGVARI